MRSSGLAHVHQLLQKAYGLERVTLSPLHLFDHDDRGVYHVDVPEMCAA